jgi:geranylgeranyl pyrophosphate synthase
VKEVEARMRVDEQDVDPNIKAAVDQLIASGGKRIRPTLTLLVGDMLGARRSRTITLAAAIELLHTATLVHDDLIDGSMVRRGTPTLNAQWSPAATVLTGDYVFARAAHLAAETGSLPLMKLFAQTLMTMVNGEITQLFDSASSDSMEDYYKRIYAKTASLFEVAAQGAAVVAGCGEETVEQMRFFGYEVGIAFQIVDDVLDFVGDEARVGKPVANDLRQGLITLPTLLYLQGQPLQPGAELGLTGNALQKGGTERLIRAIRNSGAITQSMETAERFVQAARTRLQGMPACAEREALFDLAEYVTERSY